MKKLNTGFTLAETLVTIGILSIIAAVTLPLINNIRPNQEQILLKKVYYLIGRNVTELVNDDDFYRDTGEDATAGFANTEAVKYHGSTYGSDAGGDNGNKKFCELFAAKMNVKDNISCDPNIDLASSMQKGKAPSGHFTTADGMVWLMPISNFSNKQSIYIDVNGEKGPNCFSEYAYQMPSEYRCDEGNGPDRFEINVDKYGKLEVPDKVSRIYLRRNDTSKNYKDTLKHEVKLQKVSNEYGLK